MHNTCRRIMSGNDKTPSHCINSVYNLYIISKQFFTGILTSLASWAAQKSELTQVTQVLLPYHYNVLSHLLHSCEVALESRIKLLQFSSLITTGSIIQVFFVTSAACLYFSQTHLELKVRRSRTKGNRQIYLYFSESMREGSSLVMIEAQKIQILRLWKGSL